MHDPISISFNHYRAEIKWMYVCMYVCMYYSTITLSSEKIHNEKQNNFVIYLYTCILAKVAAKWQLLTLLFRKSEGDNKSQICDFSRYFSRKGKNLVANATVLVAISSPGCTSIMVQCRSEISEQRRRKMNARDTRIRVFFDASKIAYRIRVCAFVIHNHNFAFPVLFAETKE